VLAHHKISCLRGKAEELRAPCALEAAPLLAALHDLSCVEVLEVVRGGLSGLDGSDRASSWMCSPSSLFDSACGDGMVIPQLLQVPDSKDSKKFL
jgi:hypothetical protein